MTIVWKLTLKNLGSSPSGITKALMIKHRAFLCQSSPFFIPGSLITLVRVSIDLKGSVVPEVQVRFSSNLSQCSKILPAVFKKRLDRENSESRVAG